MPFLLFFFKVFVFNLVLSQLLGRAVLPGIRSLTERDSRRHRHPEGASAVLPYPDAYTCAMLVAVCFGQGLVVAAARVLSLDEHLDASRTLWFLVGLGSFLPVTISGYPEDDTRIRVGQAVGYAGAWTGYILGTLYPVGVPHFLLRVSELLAV